MMNEHRVLALWIRRQEGAPLESRSELAIETGRGIAGDHSFGRLRHVTILFEADWNAAAAELGRPVDPVGRRANVLVSGGGGARFVGRQVRLGPVRLEIKGITRPCPVMEKAAPGLEAALRPDGRSGIWGRVLEGGQVTLGAPLEEIAPAAGPADGEPVTIARRDGGFVLTCSQWLPQPLASVFPFFADARNLERITPPFLKFRVLSMSTPAIEAGTLIHYTLRLHGIPIPWTSRIEVWEPPHRFVDLQRRGPYRRWHHTHEFTAERGGTRVRDHVQFALPFAFLHHTPVAGMIERDVRRIFAYRQDVLARHFGAAAPGGAA